MSEQAAVEVKKTKRVGRKAAAAGKKTGLKAKGKSDPKMCAMCKKAAPKSKRSRFCRPCYKVRRTKQLADNNVVWRKRVAKGTAGHHVRYRNRPTEWAAEHKSQALKLVKKMKFGAEEAAKIIQKHVKASA